MIPLRALLIGAVISMWFVSAAGDARAADNDRVVVPLPAELDDVQPAAGGRLLVLHLPKLEQFAFFDTTTAKIVKYIPCSGDKLLYAATLHKLVVVSPKAKSLERFDLVTGASELKVSWTAKSTPVSIAAGYASDGPICIFANYQNGWTFLDAQTFKPLDLKRDGIQHGDTGTMCVRAAADGSAFAAWQTGRGGFCVLSIEGSRWIYRLALESQYAELPTFDGLQILSDLGTLKTSGINFHTRYKSMLRTVTLVPTYSPALYVAIDRGKNILTDESHNTISLLSTLDHRKLLTFPDIQETIQTYYAPGADGTMSPEKRLHIFPDIGLIVTIPPSNDKLMLHRFNLLKLLAASGQDYLFSGSLPPHRIARGTELSYQIAVLSNRGHLIFRLESGPDGMTISPVGLVTWRCPDAFPDQAASAIISVHDDSGQEIYHNLSLTIE